MLEIMQESSGNILGVRASAKLNADDYKARYIPALESLSKRYDKFRVLLYMDETFRGWTLGAAWTNTLLTFRHRTAVEKIAGVGGPAWEARCIRLPLALVMRAEVRTFGAEQLPEAWDWIRTSMKSAV